MFNLIDQSDILKGLDDQRLQQEMQQPSGGVPPYLVLAEISRRKDMRSRYAGELAQQRPKTTVMQDVLAAPSMPGMGATSAPAAPPAAGLAAAAPVGGGMPSPGGLGFGFGGIVDAADAAWNGGYGAGYGGAPTAAAAPTAAPALAGLSAVASNPGSYDTIVQQYQSDLADIKRQREQQAALALLAAGAGMMSNPGISNFAQNLGMGVQKGIGAYESGLQATDARETAALRGLQELSAADSSKQMQQLQYQLELRKQQQVEDPNSVQNTPTIVRNATAIANMPEGPAKDMAMQAAAMQSQRLDPDTLEQIATQYLAGDKSVLTGFGRTTSARIQIANAVAAKAASLGMNGNDIAAQMNAYIGNTAAQRAAGTRAAQVGIASDEADKMADLALTASKAVPRSQYVPFNKIANAVATGTSSPQMAAFYSSTMSLVNAYARAISPIGAPTDAMREKAIKMLNTAQGPEAYAATIAQMKKEMEAALNAPAEVSAALKAGISTPGGTVPTVSNGTTSTNIPFKIEP